MCIRDRFKWLINDSTLAHRCRCGWGRSSHCLRQLQRDDLPRFVARFKELLNENTIREVAQFQSQLHRERATIKERIARIN